MKNILVLFLAIGLVSCGDSVRKKEYKSPDEVYGELFEKSVVALTEFDPKQIADAIPKGKPEDIIEKYKIDSKEHNFDIAAFFKANFTIPSYSENQIAGKNITEYIENYWDSNQRKPHDDESGLIPTRLPYLVSGGKFEEYEYQSMYFSICGLMATQKDSMAMGLMLNSIQFIQDFDKVPAGNRSYMLSRSSQPFLSLSLEKIFKNDPKGLLKYLANLTKEYQYWMSSENKEEALAQTEAKKMSSAFKKVVFLENDHILNRYNDSTNRPRPEAYSTDKKWAAANKTTYQDIRASDEANWTFSNRWRGTSGFTPTQILPVDLNALLYHYETTLAKAYDLKGEPNYANSFKALAAKRKEVFNKTFWNEEKGYFFDYDFKTKTQLNKMTLAGIYPLITGLASNAQATKIAQNIEKYFLKPGGLSNIADEETGSAGLQMVTIQGLEKYGFKELASKIKARWLANNTQYFAKTNKIEEHLLVSNNGTQVGVEIYKNGRKEKAAGVLMYLLH